ncbi:MAG: polyprenyl synthetase family protein, partial [candidate division Zixibacteria bacterium]|nr:polyprenyl synthetase family protein [candidate division Zixibacteria bacterium]
MQDTNSLQEYVGPVKTDLDEFDRRLTDYLRGDSPLISSIARHLLRTRGKRIRPAFMFLSSRAADSFTEHSVSASLAIELIHTATLLHDDVVDESDLRRGQETVNAQWTNLISVLMGDYLFAKAFRILVETNSIELMGAVSSATERVSVGELRQIE